MPFVTQVVRHFGLRVILPVVAVIAGALVTVIVSLNEMADAVNRIEQTTTAHSVESALKVTLRRIGDTHRDYALWDDAVRNLYGEFDEVFFRENFATSTADPVFFDTVILLDEDGNELVGYRNGSRLALPALPSFGTEAVARLLDGLPRDGRTYAVHTGIVTSRSGLFAVAVGPIVPASKDFANPPHRARLLLVGRSLGDAAITRLGEDYQISSLHLVGADGTTTRSVPVVNPAGTVVGRLAWSPSDIGQEAHASVGPVVITMLGLVALIVIILAAIASRSVDEIKRREAEARHAANHDGLTGLPNRTALVREIGEALEAKRRGGPAVAITYLDLDGFKSVNDAYGHETGDRLLRAVATAFQGVVEPAMLARIGGDEFAVLVRGDNAARLACDLGWRLIAAVSRPFEVDGRVIPLGTSVGVSVADAVNPNAEELLRRADVAMYQAKQQGRNRMFVYDPLIDTVRHERIEIAGELRKALAADDLGILYQPIVDAISREIVGAEALIRWTRPLYGAVPPATFIAIAEETGIIVDLGAWMIRRACTDARDWGDLKLSVNVSPAQFRNPGFEGLLRDVLEETGFPPRRLEVEITETYIMVQPDLARRAIDGIRNLGVSVALDDFGTGYSSIGYLRHLSFDRLKLDQSLVAGIALDRRVRRLVEATVAVAEALDLEVTAEGVESETDAKLLQLAGCRYLQGFHLGRPCPASEMRRLLTRRNALRGISSESA